MVETVEVRGNDLVRELESGIAMLVYDVPYPPSKGEVKKLRPWYSWYDWSTSLLRSLGYPIQYSVVLIEETRIEAVKEAVKKIEEKRQKLNESGFSIPPPRVSVIRFSTKTREDAETLLTVIKEGLKTTLEAFVDDIKRQLEEGRDRTKLQKRVRAFIKKIRRQDFLELLLRDPEIRNLVLQLEILTA